MMKIETYTRSLTPLGKPTSEYGAMLVTSIMGKLPMDIRRNLVRAHGTPWYQVETLAMMTRQVKSGHSTRNVAGLMIVGSIKGDN